LKEPIWPQITQACLLLKWNALEAAGLMNIFGSATIRGICGYANSHKNDGWQDYAAETAPVCAKAVIWTHASGEIGNNAGDVRRW